MPSLCETKHLIILKQAREYPRNFLACLKTPTVKLGYKTNQSDYLEVRGSIETMDSSEPEITSQERSMSLSSKYETYFRCLITRSDFEAVWVEGRRWTCDLLFTVS